MSGEAGLSEAPGASTDAAAEAMAAAQDLLQRARAFAEPLLAGRQFETGEDTLAHADGVSAILHGIGAAPSLRAAAYLVYASDYLSQPQDVLQRAFGPDAAALVLHTVKLVQVQRNARDTLANEADGPLKADQVERIRKMLLAFSRDLRVVLLRLASRLQTLRFYAESKRPCPRALARESLQIFAPLANRLGIWQIKWELEDLSFRFLMPDTYRSIAKSLDEKRLERERHIEQVRAQLAEALRVAGIDAQVQGRPKHLYSIWKKMQGKALSIDKVFDLRALRIIVADVHACYAALSCVHELWRPLPDEFSDYIARPKPNGYQSLHTVVVDAQGRSIEIQIRTQAMHDHAESGVAAHWAYKEAGTKGYAGVQAAGDFESRVAEARKTVLRQLLAWERDLAEAEGAQAKGGQGGAAAEASAGGSAAGPGSRGLFDDRIYVFTPGGDIIDLPAGATAVDLAYTLHTNLGHRCRGARVDGAMVPLQTPLRSGQTVEIVSVKEGGPSMDWLNPELGYLQSPRARAKVRAWFNALAQQATIARGREAVEKLLQREGKTAIKLDDLAAQLGFRDADKLFDVVGKDEFSLRSIEQALRPSEPAPHPDEVIVQKMLRGDADARSDSGDGKGILVVGMDSLLTQLARCCKPAPPDAIGGYVTRGKGVAVHRQDCSNFRHMAQEHRERVIPVTWGRQAAAESAHYAVDVCIDAHDRPGLLRDVFDVLAQGKTAVLSMHNQAARDQVHIILTLQTSDTGKLGTLLSRVSQISGILRVRRK
ncbi:MAG: bifunctional (p)ppGpp synthetase/guanosine-3',5'-bis(diphosphate) 3'-pyrophosphohydrolase [Proteobacteria bacterium]|uniref:RelA/SpoT family protein n=1 Tax=Aquabacterium sp. TaxID=1872578 RepID=UPI0035C70A5E|nr:bifunctional (p)ppGpp synthetase/guanosine-3',5'-bis(diphosphate) 3'-pyrophosphohydrolase [Pseudomonadota bacterium]